MYYFLLLGESVVEILLKTNRPPSDEEKTNINESAANNNAKLKAVEAQISETIAHIQALKLQVEQVELRLQRLRDEEAAIWETADGHRRVLSGVRNIPEDVLREILIACVDDIPTLSDCQISLPYALAQISSGLRRVALNTPTLWARMDVPRYYYDDRQLRREGYLTLARRANKWLERAGGLPLTLFIRDPTENGESDSINIFFGTLLSYSKRWKEIKFQSKCQFLTKSTIRITALKTIDLPLLESVSLSIECSVPHSRLSKTGFLTIPTLKHLSLETNCIRRFTVNWVVLTSVSLGRQQDSSCYSRNQLAGILQQARHLIFCDIVVDSVRESAGHHLKITTLSFLKTLYISESTFGPPTSGASSMLDLITAPALETLRVRDTFFQPSLSDFLKRSPKISKLSLPCLPQDVSLMDTIGYLRHCPSLTLLSLSCSRYWHAVTRRPTWDANMLLRAFVEEGDIGVICPRLQFIIFTGEINFSLQTLQLFLNGKHGEMSPPKILPWKRIIIDINNVHAGKQTRQQMAEFVSQKKVEGLDVETSWMSEICRRDRIFDW